MYVTSGMADSLRFGEGFAEGGWKGVGKDVFRGIDFVANAGAAAQLSSRVYRAAGAVRGWLGASEAEEAGEEARNAWFATSSAPAGAAPSQAYRVGFTSPVGAGAPTALAAEMQAEIDLRALVRHLETGPPSESQSR